MPKKFNLDMLDVYTKAKQRGLVVSDSRKPIDEGIYIGIDCGVNTGIAIIENGCYTLVKTVSILQAHRIVLEYKEKAGANNSNLLVVIENPILRKHFGQTGRERLQGAGSIKRDYSIWVEFLTFNGIKYQDIAPKDVGSYFDNEDNFKASTQWKHRSSKHGRDASMMIYRYKH